METYTLTKMDTKALKTADNVCFDYTENSRGIRCIKKLHKTDPFGEDEKTHHVPAAICITKGEYVRAFDMLYGYDRYWQTIVGLLRAGDAIRLEFQPDSHTNGYMEKANLHGDSLILYIVRKTKTLVFELASSCCPDNSARMVKRHRW